MCVLRYFEVGNVSNHQNGMSSEHWHVMRFPRAFFCKEKARLCGHFYYIYTANHLRAEIWGKLLRLRLPRTVNLSKMPFVGITNKGRASVSFNVPKVLLKKKAKRNNRMLCKWPWHWWPNGDAQNFKIDLLKEIITHILSSLPLLPTYTLVLLTPWMKIPWVITVLSLLHNYPKWIVWATGRYSKSASNFLNFDGTWNHLTINWYEIKQITANLY